MKQYFMKKNYSDFVTTRKVDQKIIYVIVFLPYDGKRKLADEQAVLDKVMAQQQVNSPVDYGLVEGKSEP